MESSKSAQPAGIITAKKPAAKKTAANPATEPATTSSPDPDGLDQALDAAADFLSARRADMEALEAELGTLRGSDGTPDERRQRLHDLMTGCAACGWAQAEATIKPVLRGWKA